MKIIDIINAPWAIQPDKLIEIQAIYATHMRGEKIDLAAVEARLGRPLSNEQRAYEVIDGVAILPIEGVISKRMNLFSQISGGASSQLIERDLRTALADASVHSIVLAIDSPGGAVDGTQLLADAVRAGLDKKPIVTLASGVMASAAYWIGSAASKVYITDMTTMVGSIGVVTSHVDVSAAETARGIKTTEISAGKFKRIASQYAPLTEEGRQSIQEQLDQIYTQFVGTVAKHRGVSVDVVQQSMADGRVFIGQQAIDVGLVDGVSTLDALVTKLNQERSTPGSRTRAGVAPTKTTSTQGSQMDAKQIAADHPEIAAAFRAEGATAERERIQGIEALVVPGHEALVSDMKFDGKSTSGDVAQAVLTAESAQRQQQAKAMNDEAPKPLPQTPPAAVAKSDAEKQPMSRQELHKAAVKYQAENKGVTYVQAVQHIESQQGA